MARESVQIFTKFIEIITAPQQILFRMRSVTVVGICSSANARHCIVGRALIGTTLMIAKREVAYISITGITLVVMLTVTPVTRVSLVILALAAVHTAARLENSSP